MAITGKDLKEFFDDYDWKKAFSFASFQPKDVKRVIAHDEGENDGPDWLAIGELNDGRWFVLSAGCDYTGWDCRAGGHSTEWPTEEELCRLGLTIEEKQRLGIES